MVLVSGLLNYESGTQFAVSSDMYQPLPKNPFGLGEPTYEAYNISLELEHCSPEDLAQLRGAQLHLCAGPSIIDENYAKMLARVIGYVLIEFGRSGYTAAHDVLACVDTVQHFQLAITYVDGLIYPWKRTPKINEGDQTSLSSQPEHDSLSNRCLQLLAQPNVSPQNHTDAKALALSRDDNRCILTGIRDSTYRPINHAGNARKTQACHIFPRKLLPVVSADAYGAADAGFWAVLSRFGVVDLEDELLGAKNNRLRNILTTCLEYKQRFDTLEVWLEPKAIIMPLGNDPQAPCTIDFSKEDPKWLDDSSFEPEAIVCKVGSDMTGRFISSGRPAADSPDTVTLRNHSDPRIPLPSPRYLAIHAAAARVADLSGAGEHVNHLVWHEEARLARTHVLAEVGSDFDLIISSLSNAR